MWFINSLGMDNATPARGDLISKSGESDTEGEPSTRGPTVPGILQWLTGQAQKPILPSEKSNFKIHIKFNHDCHTESHEICFPTVSACSNSITFPTAHLKYGELKNVLAVLCILAALFQSVKMLVVGIYWPDVVQVLTCYFTWRLPFRYSWIVYLGLILYYVTVRQTLHKILDCFTYSQLFIYLFTSTNQKKAHVHIYH